MQMHAPFRCQLESGKLHVAPRAVCTATNLPSVKDAHWDANQIKKFISRFEGEFVSRITDPVYWQQFPWNGLFDGIQNRFLFNLERTHKKRFGYWEMLRRRDDMGPLAIHHPTSPCLFWGRADHSLSTHRLDIERQDPECEWWPGICNPWVACGAGGLCIWVLCADNAVTGSRPWEVNRSWIFFITDDMDLLDMPAPHPFTTSSVEIFEVVPGDDAGSVCSDFVHVGTEPVPAAEPQPQQLSITASLPGISSSASNSTPSESGGVGIAASLPGTSSSSSNSAPTALEGWELVE